MRQRIEVVKKKYWLQKWGVDFIDAVCQEHYFRLCDCGRTGISAVYHDGRAPQIWKSVFFVPGACGISGIPFTDAYFWIAWNVLVACVL